MCSYSKRPRHLPYWSHLAGCLIALLVVALAGCSNSERDPKQIASTQTDLSEKSEVSYLPEVSAGGEPADWASAVRTSIRGDGLFIRRHGRIDSLGLDDGWVAYNAPQRLELAFGDDRAAVRLNGTESWVLELKTRAWGRGDSMTPVGNGRLTVGYQQRTKHPYLHPDAERVLFYRRKTVRDSYDNSQDGLIHHLSVNERPPGDGPLRVEITVGGELTSRVVSEDSAAFVSDTGEHVLNYTRNRAVTDKERVELSAHLETEGSNLVIVIDDEGATYPISFSHTVTQVEPLPDYKGWPSMFGFSVAVSDDTVVVGAPSPSVKEPHSGAAYVYRKGCDGYVRTERLLLDNGSPGDMFGSSVAVSGNTIVVGARGDGDNGDSSGAAYVFQDRGSGFVRVARLTPTDGAAGDLFGQSVAVSGSTIVVGAFMDDSNGPDSGSAYVFEGHGGGFVQTAKLTPAEGAPGDRFGFSAAVSDDTIVVGTASKNERPNSNSAYVFEDSENGFLQTTEFTPENEEAPFFVGLSVAASGDTIVVGTLTHNDDRPGSAYVLQDSGNGFVQTTKLLSNDRGTGAGFGRSVAVSGDTIVVAGSKDDDGSPLGLPLAYVFEDNGSGFVETTKLVSFGYGSMFFGISVAASADAIVVGAPGGWGLALNSPSFVFEPPRQRTACMRETTAH